jgi:hypothetical protein
MTSGYEGRKVTQIVKNMIMNPLCPAMQTGSPVKPAQTCCWEFGSVSSASGPELSCNEANVRYVSRIWPSKDVRP